MVSGINSTSCGILYDSLINSSKESAAKNESLNPDIEDMIDLSTESLDKFAGDSTGEYNNVSDEISELSDSTSKVSETESSGSSSSSSTSQESVNFGELSKIQACPHCGSLFLGGASMSECPKCGASITDEKKSKSESSFGETSNYLNSITTTSKDDSNSQGNTVSGINSVIPTTISL